MKTLSIKYGKLVNLGNYQNEHYDVELAIEEGDSVQDCFTRARGMVGLAIHTREEADEKAREEAAAAALDKRRGWAEGVLANPAAYDTWDVREAAQLLGVPNPIEGVAAAAEDMPF